VLAILTLGTVPLAQVAVKRQKEQELRESLRTMREAIISFIARRWPAPRSSAGTGGTAPTSTGGGQAEAVVQGAEGPAWRRAESAADPPSAVFITDQTIFTADNVDRSASNSVTSDSRDVQELVVIAKTLTPLISVSRSGG